PDQPTHSLVNLSTTAQRAMPFSLYCFLSISMTFVISPIDFTGLFSIYKWTSGSESISNKSFSSVYSNSLIISRAVSSLILICRSFICLLVPVVWLIDNILGFYEGEAKQITSAPLLTNPC